MDNQNKKLHSTLLIIADEIDRICRKNDINYSMIGGTLLGAIRHKGFIPWDDDMDFAMTRKDYDKFFDVCTTELDKRFAVYTIENSENYGYGFGKVVLRNTRIKQEGSKEINPVNEIWVDIFPFDNIPDSFGRRLIHKSINYLFIKLIEERLDGFDLEGSSLAKKCVVAVLHVINKFIKLEYLKAVLIKNQRYYDSSETSGICSMAGSYKYEKETQKKTFFEDYIRLPFEGREYQAISGYEMYLTSAYGDYMKLPPVEKRHTHKFELLDFGPYSEE